jgi:anti-sigma B factor antagonist
VVTIQGHDAGDYFLVAVSGELDIATAPALRECFVDLHSRGHVRIVIDCRDLQFLDASGLSVLVTARTYALSRGGWVQLIRMHPRVQRVLQITKLTRALTAAASVRDAPELRTRHAKAGRPEGP